VVDPEMESSPVLRDLVHAGEPARDLGGASGRVVVQLHGDRVPTQRALQRVGLAFDDDTPALPAARGRTMAANLPAKEKAAWAKLPNDQEKARAFIGYWQSKIAKFVTEEA